MTSLSGSYRCRFGVIAVGVTSLIVFSCVFAQTAEAAATKRGSDDRVFIEMLKSFVKHEEEKSSKTGTRSRSYNEGNQVHSDRGSHVRDAQFTEASNCGSPVIPPNLNSKSSDRIVGGIEANPNSWPWQCSLQVYNGPEIGFEHSCGASVSSNNNVVITAAHCVVENNIPYSLDLVSLQVVCGIQYLNQPYDSPGVQVSSVSQIIVHRDYNTTDNPMGSDIALLVLSTPLVFSRTVSPICLSTYNPTTDDTACYVTGWGLTKENGKVSNALLQVNMPVASQAFCNSAYEEELPDNMLCAYKPGGKDSCQGDSGGPFVCFREGTWSLQGVVSFGYGCGRTGIPGIYARVFKFQQWIKNTINGISISSGDLPTSSTPASPPEAGDSSPGPSGVDEDGSGEGYDDNDSDSEISDSSDEDQRNSRTSAKVANLEEWLEELLI